MMITIITSTLKIRFFRRFGYHRFNCRHADDRADYSEYWPVGQWNRDSAWDPDVEGIETDPVRRRDSYGILRERAETFAG